jgi:hypothetical protein
MFTPIMILMILACFSKLKVLTGSQKSGTHTGPVLCKSTDPFQRVLRSRIELSRAEHACVAERMLAPTSGYKRSKRIRGRPEPDSSRCGCLL